MKKLLQRAALALALVMGISGVAAATTATNASTVIWSVTGHILRLPGYAPDVTFTCSGLTTTNTSCNPGVGSLNLTFAAPDTTHFNLTFNSTNVCGPTSCTPLDAGTDAAFATAMTPTCNTTTFNGSQTVRVKFPCSECFGGETPAFTITWVATSNPCTP